MKNGIQYYSILIHKGGNGGFKCTGGWEDRVKRGIWEGTTHIRGLLKSHTKPAAVDASLYTDTERISMELPSTGGDNGKQMSYATE